MNTTANILLLWQSAGAGTTVSPGTGVGTFAGFAATVAVTLNIIVSPGVGAATFTGYAPTVTASNHQTVSPGVGSATLTGFAPAVVIGNVVYPDVGVAVFAGFAPTATASDHKTVSPGVGAALFAGFAPAANIGVSVYPDVGVATFAGLAPTVAATANITVSPGTGVGLFTGYAPTVTATEVTTGGGGGFSGKRKRVLPRDIIWPEPGPGVWKLYDSLKGVTVVWVVEGSSILVSDTKVVNGRVIYGFGFIALGSLTASHHGTNPYGPIRSAIGRSPEMSYGRSMYSGRLQDVMWKAYNQGRISSRTAVKSEEDESDAMAAVISALLEN